MKAYKVEILVLDFERLGEKEVRWAIECAGYANDCLAPQVMKVTEAEIGDWSDDHPLNRWGTVRDEYERLFAPGQASGEVK